MSPNFTFIQYSFTLIYQELSIMQFRILRDLNFIRIKTNHFL